MTSLSIALIPNATYTLTYELAGNQRGSHPGGLNPDWVSVSINGITETHSLECTAGFQLYSLSFDSGPATSTNIIFQGLGGDHFGMLLDNVKLESVGNGGPANPVPESGTMLMMLSGLSGLGGVVYAKVRAKIRKT